MNLPSRNTLRLCGSPGRLGENRSWLKFTKELLMVCSTQQGDVLPLPFRNKRLLLALLKDMLQHKCYASKLGTSSCLNTWTTQKYLSWAGSTTYAMLTICVISIMYAMSYLVLQVHVQIWTAYTASCLTSRFVTGTFGAHLSAIRSLVPRQRQGVRWACYKTCRRNRSPEQHVHLTSGRIFQQKGFLALQETVMVLFHTSSSN